MYNVTKPFNKHKDVMKDMQPVIFPAYQDTVMLFKGWLCVQGINYFPVEVLYYQKLLS